MGVRRGEAPSCRDERPGALRARRSGAGHWGPASDGDGVRRGEAPVKMSTPQLTPAVPTRFLSIDDLTPTSCRPACGWLRNSRRRRRQGFRTTAARRQAHRSPVRETVVAHAPPSRSRCGSLAAMIEPPRESIRRARNDRGRRSQSRAVGVRRRRADLRTGTARSLRGCSPAPPGSQRAHR